MSTTAVSLSAHPVILAAQQLATAHHAPYDPSHDVHHVHRVTSLAVLIADSVRSTENVEVDLLVVALGGLFHDLLDTKYLKLAPGQPAPTPQERLEPFWSQFEQDAINDEQRRLVEKVVDNVSYSKEVKRIQNGLQTEWHERCLELHCVQDADKLDAIGAFGIMRCAAYSAISNRPLFAASTDPSSATPSTSSPRFPPAVPSGSDAISHFHDKLVKLEGMMKTAKGKELARERTEVLRKFIAQIEGEWDDVGKGTDALGRIRV
ncbi:hypothetical protein JCM10212_006336 [Sporobolomyces blumeae]